MKTSTLGSLVLSAPISAQSGARITLSDSPPQTSQAQSVVETPTTTPPIVEAAPDASASLPTVECNSCEMASTPQTCDSCPTEPTKKCGCSWCKKKRADKPSPCAGSHKTLFYDNDFSYLSDKDNTARCLGDNLKNRKVGKHGTLSLGGQIRWRYHSERGLGQQTGFTRFQDTENHFGLGRLRLYADWKVNNNIRFYAEGTSEDRN